MGPRKIDVENADRATILKMSTASSVPTRKKEEDGYEVGEVKVGNTRSVCRFRDQPVVVVISQHRMRDRTTRHNDRKRGVLAAVEARVSSTCSPVDRLVIRKRVVSTATSSACYFDAIGRVHHLRARGYRQNHSANVTIPKDLGRRETLVFVVNSGYRLGQSVTAILSRDIKERKYTRTSDETTSLSTENMF